MAGGIIEGFHSVRDTKREFDGARNVECVESTQDFEPTKFQKSEKTDND